MIDELRFVYHPWRNSNTLPPGVAREIIGGLIEGYRFMEARSINQVLEYIKLHFDKRAISNFGLWFRGQVDFSHGLIPSIFRQGKTFGNVKYNEMAMYREFLLLRESQNKGKLSAFEWLTLMQHYNLPTRLLDWTSNFLVALFFAIQNNNVDGALYVLDPISFNEKSDFVSGRSMYDYLNTQVIIRANLAKINTLKDFLNLPEIKNILKDISHNIKVANNSITNSLELDDAWCQRTIQTPIAVFPAQQNDRLFLQHGKFTIHGGKIVDGDTVVDIIPIESIAADSLIKIKIPFDAKESIEEELFYCGINEATIFPELEYQSNQIKRKWSK
ncbi:MAG: FRG domain-containing protein [Ignavibacteriaceae bacterium]|nr:FRG domain-containing protein [Ignavibacteriaceae bacterium]